MKHDLQTAIKDSKSRSFKSLCKEVDVNLRGKTPELTYPILLKLIVELLYPQRSNTTIEAIGSANFEIMSHITDDELGIGK